jgi:hypothetical protein
LARFTASRRDFSPSFPPAADAISFSSESFLGTSAEKLRSPPKKASSGRRAEVAAAIEEEDHSWLPEAATTDADSGNVDADADVDPDPDPDAETDADPDADADEMDSDLRASADAVVVAARLMGRVGAVIKSRFVSRK